MEKASVSNLKNNLSAYLRKVRAGHAVVIYDRDIPIARLERIETRGTSADRLALLRTQGIIRPPLTDAGASTLVDSLMRPCRSAALIDALDQDRAEDR